MARIPIVHLDSFSRSGETLFLRALDAHSRISVVHQIKEPDDPQDLDLFRALVDREEPFIDSGDPLVAHRKLDPASILVLKNAVWLHPYPRAGVILIRNPFSVMKSARVIGEESPGAMANHLRQCDRWGRGIDKALLPYVLSVDNLAAFCALYNRKMTAAYLSGMPIVHYEEFVTKPGRILRKVLGALDLPWEAGVLESHKNYQEGELGHGKIKLWQPIHRKSLDSYQSLAPEVFHRIYALTAPVLDLYGYEVKDRVVSIRDDYRYRFGSGSGLRLRSAGELRARPPRVTQP